MRLFTKIAAGVLLGIGLPIGLVMAVEIANPESTEKKEDAIAALCLFGLAPSAWGGWLVMGGHRKDQQNERERLQTTFFRLLKQGDGRITALGFAMETGLNGAVAKAYLDERAKEFIADFDVDEEGDMFYRFDLDGISLPGSGASSAQLSVSLPQQQRLAVGSAIAVKGNFDVILEAVPGVHKSAATKLVQEVTGLGLKEAKDLVEAAPTPLATGMSETIAQQYKKQLEAIGATVMVIEN